MGGYDAITTIMVQFCPLGFNSQLVS